MGQSNLQVQDDFYVFPVGGIYYVKFRDPVTRALRSKKSTGLKSKTLAGQWARKEWNRLSSIAGKSEMSLNEYAELFYTDGCPHEALLKGRNQSFGYRTKKNYRLDLENHILPDLICQKGLALIRRADSIDFRDRLVELYGYTRKASRIFQCYKNIIHTALERGLIDTDPVVRLSVPYTKQKRTAVSVNDLNKLMNPENWHNPRLRLAIITESTIGMRTAEIRGIKWRDLDPKNNAINIVRSYLDVVKEKMPKWDKTRHTIYPKNLQKLLEPLRGDPDDRVFSVSPGGGAPAYHTLRDALNKAVEKAKIPKVTMHGLRHSIQTALLGRGVNPELLRATFGWEGEEVQEDYTHRELYDLTSQMEATDNLFIEITSSNGKKKEKESGKARSYQKRVSRVKRPARHVR
jgi:integrase